MLSRSSEEGSLGSSAPGTSGAHAVSLTSSLGSAEEVWGRGKSLLSPSPHKLSGEALSTPVPLDHDLNLHLCPVIG